VIFRYDKLLLMQLLRQHDDLRPGFSIGLAPSAFPRLRHFVLAATAPAKP
jgi:hypothetical protein